MTAYLAIDARRFDLNLRLKGLQFIGHIFAIQLGVNVNAVNSQELKRWMINYCI